VVTWLALAGCSTLATVHGARTLAPGEVEAGVAISLQKSANPVGSSLAFTPQVELVGRYGVADDVDVGLRAYLLGGGADVRYRFLSRGRWDFAVAPGLDLFYLPTLGGSMGLRTPVLGEVQLGDRMAVSGGPSLLLRDQWNRVALGDASGVQSRIDAFAGGGLRWEWHGKPVVFGVSGDLYAQPVRASGLAWSAGLDLGLRQPERAEEPAPEDTGS
jgi:hypothetical protein